MDATAAYVAARERAALFELSQSSVFELRGDGTQAFLKTLLCGSVVAVPVGGVSYSPMLNLQGGTMDVCFLLRLSEDRFWLVVNERCRKKDLRHIQRHMPEGVALEDLHDQLRLFALLGPDAARLLPVSVEADRLSANGENVCFATDRLGEKGYVWAVPADAAEEWRALMEQRGAVRGTQAELDTLLLEEGIPVYGREVDDTLNPREVGLERFVLINRKNYLGREALVAAGEPRRGLIALQLESDCAKSGMLVVHRDKNVGVVTSAGYSPRLQSHAVIALVEKPYHDIGRKLRVECGDELLPAFVTALPLRAPETEETEA